MERFKDNLKVRKITISEDDVYMVSKITESKLMEIETYKVLPSRIKDLIKSNVLIVSATDSLKRMDKNKRADTIIANLKDAIKLVMKDVKDASKYR